LGSSSSAQPEPDFGRLDAIRDEPRTEVRKLLPITRRSDVAGRRRVCASLYRLLVGTDEYKSQFRIVEASLDVGVIKERFPDRQRHPLHVSGQVLTVVNRAMRTDVSKRRDTAATLRRELEQVLPECLSWTAQQSAASTRVWSGEDTQPRSWEANELECKGRWRFEVRTGPPGRLLRA
jgi:hypothetical protein